MRRSVLALATLAALSTHAAAGSAVFLGTPPVEIDYGQGMADDGKPVTQVLAGLSWASLYWKPAHLDFTAGYMGSFQDLPGRGPAVAFRTIGPATPENQLRLEGVYLALGRTIYNRKHVRTWFSARGELLGGTYEGRDLPVLGEALRVSTELFAVGHFLGASSGCCGAILSGAVAVGFYVEAEHRDVPDALGPTAVSTGLSVRLPFTFVAAR